MMSDVSKRLGYIVSRIPYCDVVIDIGTDHGYVPIAAVESGKCSSALGCDIKEGPLYIAGRNIKKHGLTDRIKLVLGNGFSGISEEMLDGKNACAVITGMGGMEIIKILEDRGGIEKSIKTYILSPQSNIPQVREYLGINGFEIMSECVLKDGKFYDIMTVVPGEMTLTKEEYLFGKNIEPECADDYRDYLAQRRKEYEKILSDLECADPANARTEEVKSELASLELRSREYEA